MTKDTHNKAPSVRPLTGRLSGAALVLLSVLALLALSACYYPSSPVVAKPAPEPSATAVRAQATQLFFYPAKGQTTEQQSRDHYECYDWAIKQTGFDPSQSAIPQERRVRVVPMPPPGHDTATLTIAGAVLGALIGGRRHAVGGAIIGATGGAIAGAASDAARQAQARQLEEAYAAQDRSRGPWLDERALGFRRAMSACLEGRGYTVK